MTFGVHKLVRFEQFWDYPCKFWQFLLHALYSDVWKKYTRCTSTFPALKYRGGILFKSLLSARSGVHKIFPQIFGLFFAIFDCNFVKIVAPPGDENRRSLVHLKEQSLLNKRCKQHQNRLINRDTILVQSMPPWTNSASAGRSVTKRTHKHHIFTPTAGAHSSISSKLCNAIEKRTSCPFRYVAIIFRANAQFFTTGCKTLIFGHWVNDIPAVAASWHPASNNEDLSFSVNFPFSALTLLAAHVL